MESWSWQLHPGSTLSLLALSASQEANTMFPLTYRAIAAEGGEQACSPERLQTIMMYQPLKKQTIYQL